MSACPTQPWRRRALLAALPALLAACAGPLQGPRVLGVSRQRLQEALERAFPLQRRLGGVLDLSLHSPQLNLLPQANRLGTVLDLALTERLGGRRFTGQMAMDYGLRLDFDAGVVRMADVRVQQLDIVQLPATARVLVQSLAPPLAEQLLEGAVLYRLPADALAQAQRLNLRPGPLQVTADGLRLELLPADAR